MAAASSAYVEAAVATAVASQGPTAATADREERRSHEVLSKRGYVPYVSSYVPYVRTSAKSSSLRAMSQPARRRSALPKDAARERYVEMGELAALEQIRRDSEALDARAIAVGPFARLDANAVAAQDGKTRGAITNLFGSQAAFQAGTMERALAAADWIEEIAYPAPADFPDAEAWVDALFAGESGRGPHHGAEPTVDYAFLWALWLSAVPYGIWSDRVGGPSMSEHVQWLEQLERILQEGLDHFGHALRPDTTIGDLACACASVIEGTWLNQCLTLRHPREPDEPIATALRRSGRLVWRGATLPPD